MTNELLTAAKDRAAQELGYKNFGDVIMEEGELNTVIDRAMEIYAEVDRTEGIREGFESARKTTIPILWNHDKMVYPTVDDYLKSRE